MQNWSGRRHFSDLLGAFLGTAFAVQHVGAGNFVVATAHEPQFRMVLHIFYMEGASAWA